MLYESTRGSKKKKTAVKGVIEGLAEDGGLYVPVEIPKLSTSISHLVGKSYKEIATLIIGEFFQEFSEEELSYCIDGAYDESFNGEDIVSIREIDGSYFLELYHGKTAAFKDMALSILPYLMTTSLKKEEEKAKICILTATSGDTGKAALEGFADVEGTEIIVFYPKDGVSQVQEKQMLSQEGKNTHVFAIEGNFDQAQSGVKELFSDESLKKELGKRGVKLSSANSINIGRLVPQIVYYVYSYVKLLERGRLREGEAMNISVPTGNFGNILAGYFAREMGIPIRKFICASNENKVLTDFFRSSLYDIRKEKRNFILTNSPSMDILISSNLERLLYLAGGRDGEMIKQWMESLNQFKMYTVMDSKPAMEEMKAFYGGFCTKEDTLKTIRNLWEKEGYLVDTHTAVAYKVYEDYKKETQDPTPTVIVSTASPYKFAEAVGNAIGVEGLENGFQYIEAVKRKTEIEIPKGIRGLQEKAILHNETIKPEKMKEAIKKTL